MAQSARPFGSLDPFGTPGRMWGAPFGTLEALKAEYHVVLGTRGLILQKNGWERRLAQQFAAPLRTGGLTSDALVGDQTLILDDWSGGDGYLAHDPTTPARYRAGVGVDPFTEPGAVQLGPHLATAQSTAFDELTVALAYGANLYVGTSDGKIYSWTGAAWSLSHDTTKAGGIRSMAVYMNRLYVGTGTDGAVFKFDGSSWSTAFTAASSTGVYAMATHYRQAAQYLYVGSEAGGTNDIGRIHYWDDSALSLGQFDVEEGRISVAAVLVDYCVFVGVDTSARRSSIYSVDRQSGGGNWTHHLSIPGAVIVSGAVLNGVLYLGDAYDGKIYSWDGESLKVVRQLGSDASAYSPQIRGLAVWRGALWVSVADTSGGTLGLLRFDGTAWSRPASGLTGTTPMGLATYSGALYYLTAKSGASALYNTNGTFRSSGEVESGLIDASLNGTGKQWRGVTISHSAIVSGQSIVVQYKLEDAGSWTTLGTSSTVGATEASFDFPHAVDAKLVAFKIQLAGSAGSSSPLKVFGLSARYLPVPSVLREWSLNVRLDGTSQRAMKLADGTEETLTGEELSVEIWKMVDAQEPVGYLDVDREEVYTVRIAGWREVPASFGGSMPQIDAMRVGWDLQGQLQLQEI